MSSPSLSLSFFSLILLLLSFLLLLSPSLPSLSSAILSIDYGSEYLKVSSISPGSSFRMVIDEQSQRKIPSVVAFDVGERQFGNGATQMTVRRPTETFWFTERVMGRPLYNESENNINPLSDYGYNVISNSRGGYSFSFADGEPRVVSVENIHAMLLDYVRQCAEDDTKTTVKDSTIVVPSFSTQKVRQSILDSAEVAGVNVLGLINDNAAAVIQYGIDRKYENNTKDENSEKVHRVIFYNMGSSSTKCTLAEFSFIPSPTSSKKDKERKMIGVGVVKGYSYDDTLGGQYFQDALTNHFAQKISTTLNIPVENIKNNKKLLTKIRIAAEKAKVVLSANVETPVYFPSVINDKDVKLTITREEFITMVQPLITRSTIPLLSLLSEHSLTPADIDNLIIIGGAVRIPAIQSALKTAMNRETLGQSIDGDESMAMGGVFRAANLSTAFQVRPFRFQDISPYSVGVKITNSEESESQSTEESSSPFSKQTSLFKRNNPLGKRKTVAFTHSSDVHINLYYENPTELPQNTPTSIVTYAVSGITEGIKNDKYIQLMKEYQQSPRLSLTFTLDNSGIVSLSKCDATLEDFHKVYINVNGTKKGEGEKNETTEGGDNNNSTNSTDDGNSTTSTPTDAADSSPPSDSESPVTPPSDSPDEGLLTDEIGSYKLKKSLVHLPLSCPIVRLPTDFPHNYNAEDVREGKSLLLSYRKRDELKKDIAAAKNNVEAHIYAVRTQLNEGKLDEFTTEESRESLSTLLSETEEWLYEKRVEETLELYQNKLSDIKLITDPIDLRRKEGKDFPAAIATAETVVKNIKNNIEDFKVNRTWIPVEDVEKLEENLKDVESAIQAGIKLQEVNPAHLTPLYTSKMIYDKLRPVVKLAQEMQKIKKPVPVKEKEKDKKEEGKEGTKKGTKGEKEGEKAEEKGEEKGEEKEGEKEEKDQKEQQGEGETHNENESHAEPSSYDDQEEQEGKEKEKEDL